MKKHITSILFISCLFGTIGDFSLFAQTEQVIKKDKKATYDYTKQQGIITLENFLPGSSTVIQEAKALDAILVLDFSGSMQDNSYTTKTGESSTYNKIVGTAITYKTTTKPEYTINGTAYPVSTATVKSIGTAGNNGYWAYVDANDNKRYYLLPDGSYVQAASKNAPTSSAFPTDTNGRTIYFADGQNGTLWVTHTSESKTISTRRDALNAAVTEFLNLIHHNADSTKMDHRVGIVTFQAPKWPKFPLWTDTEKNNYNNPSSPNTFQREMYYSFLENTTDIDPSYTLKIPTSVKTELFTNALKYQLQTFKYKDGSTAIDYGVNLAQTMLDTYGREDSEKVIIVFTDGLPNHGGGVFTETVANSAVTTSKDIKSQALVYSVYCGKDDIGTSTKMYKFLNTLSSNYPSASSYSDMDEPASELKYYKLANEGLIDVFKAIAKEIIVQVNTKYGVNTIVADFVNNQYFKLPANATADSIKCYENACATAPNSYPPSGADTVYTWKKDSTLRTDLTIHIGRAASDDVQDTIIVSGYDFSANWCGWNTSSGSKTIHGNRLLIKIPFTLKNNVSFGDLETNTEESGVYIKEKDQTEYHQDTPYPVPTIPFCKLVISRQGLHEGESAIYIVKNSDGAIIDKLSLNGTKETTVSDTLYGAPGTKFTVEETNWNWAYDKNPSSITDSCDASSYVIYYLFKGAHRDPKEETDPANLHNHDEAYTRNKFTNLPSPAATPRPDAIEPKRTPLLPCPYLIEE